MYRPETFRKSTHPWIDASQFSSLSQERILRQVIENKGNFDGDPSRPPAIVFDLDSTLFEVRYRTLRIMQEFGRKLGRRPSASDSELLNWLRRAQASDLLYGLEASAKAAGLELSSTIDREIMQELQEFWFDRFFSDHYLLADRPSPGAVEYVRLVKSSGIKVIYLSGRDWPQSGRGTVAALRHAGFPMSEEDKLVLKPKFHVPDFEFKREALVEIDEDYSVIALFDNEPKNFNVFEKVMPQSSLVFCHTVCSTADADPVHGVGRIFNFLQEK